MRRALDQLIEDPTTFLISHRLSTLGEVDRVLVLESGRCVGLGTHAELQRDCPLYQRLWKAQQVNGFPPTTSAARRAANPRTAEYPTESMAPDDDLIR